MAERNNLMHGFDGENAERMAAACARGSGHVASDLAAALFPKSQVILNDRILSNSRQYLRALVTETESEICSAAIDELGLADEAVLALANMSGSQTFEPLIEAGLLRDNIIMSELFQMAQRAEISARLSAQCGGDDIPAAGTAYLDHENPAIADAAMALLVAQSRSSGSQGNVAAHIADLPAEVLHALVKPVAAAIQYLTNSRSNLLEKAADIVAARHDESGSVTNRAMRLARHLGFNTANPSYPTVDGTELFLARLAEAANLDVSQIVTFTAEPAMVRLSMTLRSLDIPAEDAVAIHAGLVGPGRPLTIAAYNEIDADRARDMVSGWSADPEYSAAREALSKRGLDGPN